MRYISYEKTPFFLKLIAGCVNFLVILPIIVLLYQHKGLSTGDFFLLQAVFAWVTFAIEIPTGYLGDLYSRRKVLIYSIFIFLIGYISLIFAQGFWQLILVETLWAVSISLQSGTFQAYLYDVLKKINKESEYLKHQGGVSSYKVMAAGVASLMGGWLFQFNPLLPVYVMCGILVLALVFSFFFPDVKEVRRVVKKGKSKWKDILSVVHYAVKGHSEIKWLIFYPAVLFGGSLLFFWVLQPVMAYKEVAVSLFGVILCIHFMLKSVLSFNVHRLVKRFTAKRIAVWMFVLLLLGGGSGILLLWENSLSIYIVLGFLITTGGFIHSIGDPVFLALINKRVDSSERATVLSVQGMAIKAWGSIGLFLMKPMIDFVGLPQAIFIQLFLFAFAIIPLVQLHKKNIL